MTSSSIAKPSIYEVLQKHMRNEICENGDYFWNIYNLLGTIFGTTIKRPEMHFLFR